MHIEQWLPVAGYEGRYEVSSAGRLRAMPFQQRYLLRNGTPAFRMTKQRSLAHQGINSGYRIAHLHLDKKRTALLVHRLVAAAFCPGYFDGADVNHRNGVKVDNRADNLEWVTRTKNHLHAVSLGLNKMAQPVVDPATGRRYDSINQAARNAHKSHRSVSATFERAA